MSSHNKKILAGTLIALVLLALVITLVVSTQDKKNDEPEVKSSKSNFAIRNKPKSMYKLGRLETFKPPKSKTFHPETPRKMYKPGRLEKFEPKRKMYEPGRLVHEVPASQVPASHHGKKERWTPRVLTQPINLPTRSWEGFESRERFAIAECPSCSGCESKESYEAKDEAKDEGVGVFIDHKIGEGLAHSIGGEGIASAIKYDVDGGDGIRPAVKILSQHPGQGEDRYFVPAATGRADAPSAYKYIM